MEVRNKLISVMLQTTNDLNNNYCDIYNECLSQMVGQRIAYDNILNNLNNIDLMLRKEMAERNELFVSDNEAKQVVEVLANYQNLLQKRILTLQFIVNKLRDKAECIGGKYSFFSYSSDTKKLKKMENENNILGNTLQNIAVPFMNKYR